MERLFNDLQQQIARTLGSEITMTDEDYGQLEALTAGGEDQYPVTFPCVLIGAPEVSWRTLKQNTQQGVCTLTVRLAVDCYDDTRYGSTQEQKAEARMALSRKLNACLHGWKFAGTARCMVRRSSRQYSLPGGIKVYEHTYDTEVEETTDLEQG